MGTVSCTLHGITGVATREVWASFITQYITRTSTLAPLGISHIHMIPVPLRLPEPPSAKCSFPLPCKVPGTVKFIRHGHGKPSPRVRSISPFSAGRPGDERGVG